MMLAVHENESYQQNFEFLLDKYLWKALQYTKAINCNDILCSLYNVKKHHNPSIKEQFSRSPQCRTSDFIIKIRELIEKRNDYKLLKNKEIGFYHHVAKHLIKPLKAWLEEWNNSGMCYRCKKAHKDWDINSFQRFFDKVVKGKIQEKNGACILLLKIKHFQETLDWFEQTYECIERQ